MIIEKNDFLARLTNIIITDGLSIHQGTSTKDFYLAYNGSAIRLTNEGGNHKEPFSKKDVEKLIGLERPENQPQRES